jgi:hypothetical protein
MLEACFPEGHLAYLHTFMTPVARGHLETMPISHTPQSFFKSLFMGTCLEEALKNMILTKAVPGGLQPQECEHGSSHNKPQIPYIHEKDECQETVEAMSTTLKLNLPHKVELRVSI